MGVSIRPSMTSAGFVALAGSLELAFADSAAGVASTAEFVPGGAGAAALIRAARKTRRSATRAFMGSLQVYRHRPGGARSRAAPTTEPGAGGIGYKFPMHERPSSLVHPLRENEDAGRPPGPGQLWVRPEEALNLLALGALSLVTILVGGRLDDSRGILLRYAIMAAATLLVVVLTRREDRLPRPVAFLLDFYPAAFIPVLYETLGPLIEAARGKHGRDSVLIAADRALFHVDVTVWLERFVRPALTNFFYLSYTTYYFIALALGFALWRRSKPDLRRFIFTLTLCYYVSYTGYFLLPALGPRVALADRQTMALEVTPMSEAIAHTLNELEHTKFDAFPSGHTMIAAVVLLVAFRRARDVFAGLFPVAVCLILSTVYCRYHYVVDVLAGLILAIATVPIGDRIYDGLVERRARRLRRATTAGA
jgi:membrane-associated phospholipid phosphatase